MKTMTLASETDYGAEALGFNIYYAPVCHAIKNPLLQRNGALLGFAIGDALGKPFKQKSMLDLMSRNFRLRYSAEFTQLGLGELRGGRMTAALQRELQLQTGASSNVVNHEPWHERLARCFTQSVLNVEARSALTSAETPLLRCCLTLVSEFTAACHQGWQNLHQPEVWQQTILTALTQITDSKEKDQIRALCNQTRACIRKHSSEIVDELSTLTQSERWDLQAQHVLLSVLLAMQIVCKQAYQVKPAITEALLTLNDARLCTALVGGWLGLAHGQGALPDEWVANLVEGVVLRGTL